MEKLYKPLDENIYFEWNPYNPSCWASIGDIDGLKWLKNKEYIFDENTCKYAARGGHLECLKWLHAPDDEPWNGCGWNSETCSYAAENGHLDCLIYAHTNGCSWNRWTCICAARYGHLDCLMYAIENGCPLDDMAFSFSRLYEHFDCLQYMSKY